MQRRKLNPWIIGGYICLIVVTFLILFPLALMISSSFKDEMAIFEYPVRFIPKNPIISNYLQLREHFPLYIFNSFKVTLIIVCVQFISATTGGYAFAKLKWRGRDLVFLLYIGSLMIPIHVYIIPQFILVRQIGLYDSHLALVLVSSFTALGTFLMKQFFMTIPRELDDAAKIDGCSFFRIYSQIYLPLSKPALATLAVFTFMSRWNDLLGPLIYLHSKAKMTVSIGLAQMGGWHWTDMPLLMAACFVALVPTLLVYLAAQRYYIEGVVLSGMKL